MKIAKNVRRIRHNLGLTQREFAHTFCFSVSSVRDWEQGRHVPRRYSQVLLTVIDREPEAVMRALRAG